MSTIRIHGDGAADGRNSLYFLDFVQFRVQEELFRVPTIGFTIANPDFFYNLGTYSQQSNRELHDEVLELKKVSRAEFEGLLLVMYPFARTAQTYDEWLGALHLATLWDFADIRDKAISFISTTQEFKSMTPIDLVRFAKEYKVAVWLRDAYTQLVLGQSIDVDELRSSSRSKPLDWETISRLLQAQSLVNGSTSQVSPTAEKKSRESCEGCVNQADRSHCKTGYSPTYRCAVHPPAGAFINRVFRQEFVELGSELLVETPAAGERLATIGTSNDKFPDSAQTGPPAFHNDEAVFIASAILANSVIPCKMVNRTLKRCVYFSLNDKKRSAHGGRVDILPYSSQTFEWVKASHGRIPADRKPVEGGYEEDGRLLYHAAGVMIAS
ncbi:hypothetical protein CPB83DRAFT_858059 [Crepidotus variabilis]|uniref:BTB domain-containing protein n=1 Tax=Crepidotus variabilis TaxID=179855 RepID=A0A9P6JNA1_9AGAR|nr:hypothetical protein CPB83DRAFT_858059 [Crepidotus variabilis]